MTPEPIHILIVDDCENMQALLSMMLENIKDPPILVATCSDLNCAIANLKNVKYDLILLDHQLGLQQGFWLLKSEAYLENKPMVIYLTMHEEPVISDICDRYGIRWVNKDELHDDPTILHDIIKNIRDRCCEDEYGKPD